MLGEENVEFRRFAQVGQKPVPDGRVVRVGHPVAPVCVDDSLVLQEGIGRRRPDAGRRPLIEKALYADRVISDADVEREAALQPALPDPRLGYGEG